MNKVLHQFFTKDHDRIENLLDKASENPERIEMTYYSQFRSGLLRHIKMEERILFPAARKVNKELISELLPRFRAEHGALTALMVPPPDSAVIKAIRYVMEKHNEAEEKDGGMYEVCEELTHGQTQELIEELEAMKEVPTLPHNTHPIAMEAAKRALERADYDYDVIIGE